MFMVDTTPNSKKASVDVPSYSEKFDVLDHDAKETSEKKKISRSRSANTCFNCDGAHAIKDCPEPRNQSKINKARESFNSKRVERYHCDIEQKFGHLKPGKISERLREALGLGKHDLPMHTYVMRSIGYPPGWLEDAKITNSGLALFDSLGQPVLGSDEDEGEVEGVKYKYDTAKLIDFPGFNVEPPRGTVDVSNIGAT
jgi:zinc finger CCHC domain-containing protein 8